MRKGASSVIVAQGREGDEASSSTGSKESVSLVSPMKEDVVDEAPTKCVWLGLYVYSMFEYLYVCTCILVL